MDEYVKIKLDTYDSFKNSERKLNEIINSISYFTKYYDKDDNEIDINSWKIITERNKYKSVSTININIENILKILNFCKDDFDVININGIKGE